MSGSGFFKGEKKKQKKGKDNKQASYSTAPTFTMPTVIPKGKKEQ